MTPFQNVFPFLQQEAPARAAREIRHARTAAAPVAKPPPGRSPFGFLVKVRHSSLPGDAVIVLLAVANGIHRWTDIQDATGLQKWQLTRMLNVLAGRGLIERHQSPRPVGPGKCCHYHLTAAGMGATREVLSHEPVTIHPRPLPVDAPASLRVRGSGFSFLA